MSYSASVAMSVASSTGMLYLAARPLQPQAATSRLDCEVFSDMSFYAELAFLLGQQNGSSKR